VPAGRDVSDVPAMVGITSITREDQMKAKITIELTDEKPKPGVVDVAHDADFFRKHIPELHWHGKHGDQDFRMGDRYTVSSVTIHFAG
jgi:hypothetical protein